MSRQIDRKQVEKAEQKVIKALVDFHSDKCSVADILAVIEEVDSQNGLLEKILIDAHSGLN
jgi:hypothetical protein